MLARSDLAEHLLDTYGHCDRDRPERNDCYWGKDARGEFARQRFAEAESDFHTARRRMDEIGKIIDRIVAVGETDMHIPSWRS